LEPIDAAGDTPEETTASEFLQETPRVFDGGGEGVLILGSAVVQRLLHDGVRVPVACERRDVAEQYVHDVRSDPVVAVLQEVLHYEIAKRVAAKGGEDICIACDAIHEGDKFLCWEMLNQPLQHTAAKPVSSKLGEHVSLLQFIQDEIHRCWRQKLDRALEHVVRVRRVDRVPHMAR